MLLTDQNKKNLGKIIFFYQNMYPCQWEPREWGFISSKIRGPKANIFDTSNPQPLRIGAVASNIYIIVLK